MTGKRNLIELRTKVLCALVKTALKNKATAPHELGSSADYLTYLSPFPRQVTEPDRSIKNRYRLTRDKLSLTGLTLRD